MHAHFIVHLADGMTGAGKTYTMSGNPQDADPERQQELRTTAQELQKPNARRNRERDSSATQRKGERLSAVEIHAQLLLKLLKC